MGHGKHKWNIPRKFSYESSCKLNVFDKNDPNTIFMITFQCQKCDVEIEVTRSACKYFDLMIRSGDFQKLPTPNSFELRNTPNCKKWQLISKIMNI
jgi:hypothetical protein